MTIFNTEKFSKLLFHEIEREKNKIQELEEFKNQIIQANAIKFLDPNFKFSIGEFFGDFEIKPHDKNYFRKHFKTLPSSYDKNLLRFRRRTKKYYLVSDEHERMTDFCILFYYHTSEYQKFGAFPYFEKNGIRFFDSIFLRAYPRNGLLF
jgi:hypothetical protein